MPGEDKDGHTTDEQQGNKELGRINRDRLAVASALATGARDRRGSDRQWNEALDG